VLVAWGFTEAGERVLLSVMLGMRESHEDWLALGRDLIARGLGAPLLIVAEGVRPSVCEAEATGVVCQSGSRSPKWILRAVSAGVQERADLHFVSARSMAR
jgi:Transposase, Mutator family